MQMPDDEDDVRDAQEQDLRVPIEELTSDQKRSGVEVERVSEAPLAIREPFDPEKIDVKTKAMVVDLIMARIRGGTREIDLMPDFQRRAGVWDTTRKSRLIESLLLRIPLPVFYMAANEDECWSVVDGLQRITTLKEFLHDKTLRLEGLEFLRDLNGKRFGDLTRQMQRRIQETEVLVHIIQPGTPSAVMFNIFKRINTGGMPLSGQEIRHAIKQGVSTRLLKELAESDPFKKATRDSIKDERMADRECVLRFCAFWITSPEKYALGDLDAFLIDAMDQINKWAPEQVEQLKERFFASMNAAQEIFGGWAFRKYYGQHFRRTPINKAIFESWAVNLANLPAEDLAVLKSRRELVMKKFALLMGTDFEKAISIGTGTVANVRRRFRDVAKLVGEVLNADESAS
jgi:hypothetical protein